MINVDNVDWTVLYDYAQQIVDEYKKEINNQKVSASGELADTATFDFDFNDNNVTLYLVLALQWYYVEYGRRPTGSGAGQKWPNAVGDIEQWIKNKMQRGWFVPRNNREIPKTDKDIRRTAWGITKKIHKVGWYGDTDHYGLHILQTILEKAEASGLLNKIVQGITEQYNNEVNVELQRL